jgi:hypothetical protein
MPGVMSLSLVERGDELLHRLNPGSQEADSHSSDEAFAAASAV